MTNLSVRLLAPADARALHRLLTSDPPRYRRYFHPFSAEVKDLRRRLTKAGKDPYWGIFCGRNLAAMFMARGLDEGYAVPSFGVYVAHRFSGRGLSRLALQVAESWCILNAIGKIRLSVHPKNVHARRTYRLANFKSTGRLSESGHMIYVKELPD